MSPLSLLTEGFALIRASAPAPMGKARSLHAPPPSEVRSDEKLAVESKEIRDEIDSVNAALYQYALTFSKRPSETIKNKIEYYITTQFP